MKRKAKNLPSLVFIVFFIFCFSLSSCATKQQEPTIEEILAGFEVGDPGTGSEGKFHLMAYKGDTKGQKVVQFTIKSKSSKTKTTLISTFSFKTTSDYKEYASDIVKSPNFPHTVDVSLSPKLLNKNKLKLGIKFEFGLFEETSNGLKKVKEKVIEIGKGMPLKKRYTLTL